MLMVLLDFYVFQAVKVIASPASGRIRTVIYTGYWVISVSAIVVLLILPYLHFAHQARFLRTTIFAIILGLFIAKLIAALFFLIDDIRRLVQWTGTKITRGNNDTGVLEAEQISRSVFLSWAGAIAGGGLFATLMKGFGNKQS